MCSPQHVEFSNGEDLKLAQSSGKTAELATVVAASPAAAAAAAAAAVAAGQGMVSGATGTQPSLPRSVGRSVRCSNSLSSGAASRPSPAAAAARSRTSIAAD